MDNRDACSLRDRKKMDACTVWQWRITHVNKYWRHPESFHNSSEIGLDFNVTSNRQEKLDFQLVTNAIILEVCDFAKLVNKSEGHFITNILENNFDLGLESEQQRIDFTTRILHRVQDLIRNPPKDKHEVFTLFDTSSEPECEMGGVHADDSEHQDEYRCSAAQSTEELKDSLLPTFPYCEEIDLNLDVGSKQTLDPGLLTKGAMLEVADFTRLLTGSYSSIVLSVLVHNFHLDLKSHQVKDQVWLNISHLLKRRKEFESEPFSIQANLINRPQDLPCIKAPQYQFKEVTRNKQEKRALVSTSEQVTKRPRLVLPQHMETDMLSHDTDLCTSGTEEGDCRDTPQGESDLESDEVTDLENTGNQEDSQNPSNSDMDQNEMAIENHLWKLRANRVKQIISGPNKQFGLFTWSQKFGLEFNVGFGPKQDFSLDSLPNAVLPEVAKFALAMNLSQQDFIMEILEYNFDFGLQSEHQRNNFTQEMMNRVRRLRKCQDAIKSSTKVFELPVPTSLLANQSTDSVNPEFSSILRMEESDVAPECPTDSPAEAEEHVSGKSMDHYPFCKKIGLRLHVNKHQPHKKLDLSKLTYGAMTEVTNFAEKLCGTFQQICLDIFRHNFDLDSQSGDSDVVKDILDQIPAIIRQRNLSNCAKSCRELRSTRNGSSKSVKLDCQNKPPIKDQNISNSTDTEHRKELNSMLWKLRTNHIQEEISVENNYTCPLGESDLDSDSNTGNQDDNSDMEQEEIGTENNLWKSRAKRVKQILSAPSRKFGLPILSQRFGLEFNVGFGPKQDFSLNSLTNAVLLEVAGFALAINSSLQDFIMEILEYNFDFGLQSEHQRNNFTHEMMNRVRRLRKCQDAIKFSTKVFALRGRMSLLTNQSVDSVNPEISSIPKMEESDVASECPTHSPAETEEHVSGKSMDHYPFCKKIGLRLHVNKRQPHKKLELRKLTYAAMTEVTNFAEKLCGTFEQICLDILRHNFDLDSQSGDSDVAKNILDRIPVAVQERNLRKKYKTPLGQRNDSLNSSCSDTEPQNELKIKLWKLRANQIQQILSIPHEEHCPLYFYSKCKKLGIDFNVGSGVKQNLDVKLLTNGIMVELGTFATALESATKHFITEILEHNFNLNLKTELFRNSFTAQTMVKVRKACGDRKRNMPFELPEFPQELSHDKTAYCPKCYQDRYLKFCQNELDPGRMHHSHSRAMTGTVSADANCTAQKPTKEPSSTLSTTEETIMNSYPRCKKIGLSLCVDKDQPNYKLDSSVLTRGIIMEMVFFARKLCGTKNQIICDLLDHNFNIGAQSLDASPGAQFRKVATLNDCSLTWLNEVFVIQPAPRKQPGKASKARELPAMPEYDRKETFKKRQLALQAKEGVSLPSPNISAVKSKTDQRSGMHLYPLCTEIGLDLDVTTKSAREEKLNLKLLTRDVVYEVNKFINSRRAGQYFPNTLFDILDYNFDISSQYHRRWEFSLATASRVQTMVRVYRKNRELAKSVFKLPFVYPKAPQRCSDKGQNKKRKGYSGQGADNRTNDDSTVQQDGHHSDVPQVSFLDVVQPTEDLCFDDDDGDSHPWRVTRVSYSSVSVGYGSPLQDSMETREEIDEPYCSYMKPEPDTETYHPHSADVKTENLEYLVPAEPAGSLGYTDLPINLNSESTTKTEPENEEGQICFQAVPQEAHYVETKSSAEDIEYILPDEAAEYNDYSMLSLGESNKSTAVTELQENVPADLMEPDHNGVMSHTL